jgi:putative SOS response-associated peptidase YedK
VTAIPASANVRAGGLAAVSSVARGVEAGGGWLVTVAHYTSGSSDVFPLCTWRQSWLNVRIMCGRYTLVRLADFTDMFPWIRAPEQPVPPRYNIAPTQPIAVVPNDGRNQIVFYQWGLVPSWIKDPAVGARTINARAETLADKPMFRTALKRRRCLIPASGFYEWKKSAGGKVKTPMYIRMKANRPFAFAGLWETWHGSDGSELRSCTIITGAPNEVVASIHDRMPVILQQEQYRRWLDPAERAAEELVPLLVPYPAETMEAFAVSPSVNSPSNDTPNCIEPWADSERPADTIHQSRSNRSSRGELPGLFP